MKTDREKKKKNIFIRLLQFVGMIVGLIIVAAIGIVVWLTVDEYKPAERESVDIITTEASDVVAQGEQITMLTWNTGYGALGDNADFFMDGGTGVQTATPDRVKSNLSFMEETIASVSPDIVFLQEVDKNSRRSYGIDATESFRENLVSKDGKHYNSTFAYNFKVDLVPYPIPPVGKVNSGIQTLTHYTVDSSERVSLPCPFSWPVRAANLKRCLLITRLPVQNGSGKELVLINLHLEAYDSGEGKIAQTALFKGILEDELNKGNYVIAGGDFNQIFSNVDVSAYPEYPGCWRCGYIDVDEFPDNVTFVTDNRVPTCRSLDRVYADADKGSFQYYVIDGYIVSNNITIESCETLDCTFKASDHNPVVMTVTLD